MANHYPEIIMCKPILISKYEYTYRSMKTLFSYQYNWICDAVIMWNHINQQVGKSTQADLPLISIRLAFFWLITT